MDLADIISGSPKLAVVRAPAEHDSAVKHVTGAAVYVDDIREPAGTLHAAPGFAPIAAGMDKAQPLTLVHTASP